jgi:hypothetical protein
MTAPVAASIVPPSPPPTSTVSNVLLLPAAVELAAPVHAQLRRTAPAARPSLVATGASKPSVSGATQDIATSPELSGAVPSGAAPSAIADHVEPANSAPSLVPVIPAGPAPEIDPLVKAVLEEDEPRRK